MKISIRAALAVAAGAVLLSGCVAYPYDDYGYGYGYDRYGPTYYDYPAYAGPTVGFGFSYYDRDDRRRWRGHRDRDWRRDRDHRHEWRGDRGGRGDWRNDHGQNSPG
jgi:hypothetical protein